MVIALWIYAVLWLFSLLGFPLVLTPKYFWSKALCFGPIIIIRNPTVIARVGNKDKAIPFTFTDQFKQTLNHEMVHFYQQRELLIVGAYFLYYVELFVKVLWYRSIKAGYLATSFEREAYGMQNVIGYIYHRKRYAFRYLIYVRKAKATTDKNSISKEEYINARIKHGGAAKQVNFKDVKDGSFKN